LQYTDVTNTQGKTSYLKQHLTLLVPILAFTPHNAACVAVFTLAKQKNRFNVAYVETVTAPLGTKNTLSKNG